jgi:type IV pilus assembly protein PilE
MNRTSGFTLVELMVVMAISAILASVAVPAYVNYKNRALQTEAVEALLRAKMDQEVFWTENNRYAGTVGMLSTFGNTRSLASYTTPSAYTIQVTSADASSFKVLATKTFYSYAQADTMSITQSDQRPRISNTDALKFSLFKWLFD